MQPIQSNHFDKIWAKEFSNMLKKKTTEPIGDGWLKFDEILKKSLLSKYQLQVYLALKVKDGSIEKFRGSRFVTGQKKLHCCIWYRPLVGKIK
jgi:hypothetical protein